MARIVDALEQIFDGAGNPLINGKLRFLESGANNTDKTTFRDSGLTIPNTNPVLLDGEGRPEFAIFGAGVYKMILTSDNGQTSQHDPIGGSLTAGQWDDWQPGLIYDSGFIVTGSDKKNYRSITNGNQGNDPTLGTTNWEELQLGRVWNTNVSYSIADNAFGSDGNLFRSIVNNNEGNDPTLDDGSNWLNITSGSSTAEQLDYSADTTMPDSQVIALNPSSAGLVVTLTTADVGDIKRLINISAFSTLIKLTGTGFLTIPAGETAFTLKVGSDWYAVNDTNETIPSALLVLGSLQVFNSASTAFLSIARITDTKIVISYEDTGSIGVAIIGDISGTVITFGGEETFTATVQDLSEVTALTSSKIAIAYRSSNVCKITIGDITGNTIIFGAEITYGSGSSTNPSVARITDTKVALLSKDATAANFGKAIIGDVTGTSVVLGTEVTFSSATTDNGQVIALSSSKMLISYNVSAPSSVIAGGISGNVITLGSAISIGPASASEVSMSRLTDTEAIIVYKDVTAGNIGKSTAGTVTGTVVTLGTPVTFIATNASSYSVAALTSSKIVIAYRNTATATLFANVVAGEVNSGVITFPLDPVVFDPGSSDKLNITRVTDDKFAIAYQATSNSSFGTTVIGEVLES